MSCDSSSVVRDYRHGHPMAVISYHQSTRLVICLLYQKKDDSQFSLKMYRYMFSEMESNQQPLVKVSIQPTTLFV